VKQQIINVYILPVSKIKSTKVEYIANNEKNEKLHPPSGNEKSFQDKVIYSRLLGVKISGTGGCPFKKIYN